MRRSESWKKQWITFQAEGPAICKVSNSRMSLACFRNREATEIPSASLAEGVDLAQVLVEAGVFKSNGECRRMIDQKGVYLNDEVVADKFYKLTEKDFDADGEAIARKGKKVYHRLKIV